VKPSTSASTAGITVNAIAPGISETPQTLDEVNSLGAKRIAATADVSRSASSGGPTPSPPAYQHARVKPPIRRRAVRLRASLPPASSPTMATIRNVGSHVSWTTSKPA
jgi:hypothetical protein